MAKLEVKTTFNGKDVGSGLNDLFKNLSNNLDKAMWAGANKVKIDAVKNTPGNTGTLKNSIFAVKSKDHSATNLDYDIGSKLFYAPYVHWGTGIFAYHHDGRKTPWVYYDSKRKQFFHTVGQKPRPFIKDAIDDNQDYVKRLVQTEVKRVLGK